MTISNHHIGDRLGIADVEEKEVIGLIVGGWLPTLIDAVGVADDVALIVLAKDLLESGDVGDAAVYDIAQHIAGADRWQLINIANEQQMGRWLQRLEQTVEELQVKHGGFVDDDHIAR